MGSSWPQSRVCLWSFPDAGGLRITPLCFGSSVPAEASTLVLLLSYSRLGGFVEIPSFVLISVASWVDRCVYVHVCVCGLGRGLPQGWE